MKKRVLFFDCFYAFSSLLSPLSLSRLHSLSSKSNKLAKSKANVKNHNHLYTSAINGQLSAILFFIRSKDQFNWALAFAAKGSHKDLCNYFIKLGATNFNSALEHAKDQTTKDFLKRLRTK